MTRHLKLCWYESVCERVCVNERCLEILMNKRLISKVYYLTDD